MNTVATENKVRPIEQHMIDTQGFYFAKVTMYRQNQVTGYASDIVETFEGCVKQDKSGIIFMVRPEANMRSNNKTKICTVSQRLISIEKVGA
jgi:hypothetical protein